MRRLQLNDLHDAVVSHDLKKIEDLLTNDKYLCVNRENDNGYTALDLAVKYNYESIANILILNRANIESKDNNGTNCLHRAARDGQKGIIKIFCAAPHIIKMIDIQQHDGWTALHLAAWNGHEEITKILIDSGANPRIKNKDFNTPIDLVNIKNHKHIVEYLYTNNNTINNTTKNNDNEECVVCYENTINFMNIRCKHKLCIKCFYEMSKMNNKVLCPMCRMNISN